MDSKSLHVLEFPKILDRLAGFAAFSASAGLIRALRPTNDHDLAVQRQARTSEARQLLSEHADVSIGGARDVRPQVELAGRGGMLGAEELMDIKSTLLSARDLHRFFSKLTGELPILKANAAELSPPEGLIEAISRVLSEKGEVLDNASEKLAILRRDLKAANAKVIARLEHILNDPGSQRMLQEPIITLRHGRYVIPIKAEAKSRMRCVVQDQSASGSTLFVEPLAVVEMNNQWHEMELAEQEEVRRILAELSTLVGGRTRAIQTVVRALALLDLSLACARYADAIHASEPLLHGSMKDEPLIRFTQARHPLLDPKTVVPIDFALEGGTHALVITGPNTGGKTVTLKTAGLLVLMAQSGLHIPAQSGSQTCVFKDVFADIGDEQSIEQSLSTFSGHITNIVRILGSANQATLVLLDELGAGTDPQEGSALARAILAYLLRRKTPCLIAPHYPELKAYAHTTPGALNASVEFDPNTLKPTYRLLMGLPGRSNALSIAQRLGISDEIIHEAREMVDPSELRAEDLLDDIQRQLAQARKERAEAESAYEDAALLKKELEDKLAHIESDRLAVLEMARQQAQEELETLRMEISNLRSRAADIAPSRAEKKRLREDITELESRTTAPVEAQRNRKEKPRPLRVGDRVYVRSLRSDGTIAAILGDEVEILVGKMRIKTDPALIERSRHAAEQVDEAPTRMDTGSQRTKAIFFPSPGMELHIRGKRADEALAELERYLEAAYAAGLPFVRIVHGKGTGTLRQLARQALNESPLVNRWETALDSEGGEGVTVAHLGE